MAHFYPESVSGGLDTMAPKVVFSANTLQTETLKEEAGITVTIHVGLSNPNGKTNEDIEDVNGDCSMITIGARRFTPNRGHKFQENHTLSLTVDGDVLTVKDTRNGESVGLTKQKK